MPPEGAMFPIQAAARDITDPGNEIVLVRASGSFLDRAARLVDEWSGGLISPLLGDSTLVVDDDGGVHPEPVGGGFRGAPGEVVLVRAPCFDGDRHEPGIVLLGLGRARPLTSEQVRWCHRRAGEFLARMPWLRQRTLATTVPRPPGGRDWAGLTAAVVGGLVDGLGGVAAPGRIMVCTTDHRHLEALVEGIDDARRTRVEAEPPGDPLPRPGDTIGKYEVVEVLGPARFGIDAVARDPYTDRRVRLKILHPYLTDGSNLASAFDDIARAQLPVHHPALLRYLDVLEHRGHTVVVTEDGPAAPVRARLTSSGGLPVEAVVRIGLTAVRLLADLHRHGIAFGPLQIDNLLLTEALEPTFIRDPYRPPDRQSPRELDGHEPDAASDRWRLGLLLLQLASAWLPAGPREAMRWADDRDRSWGLPAGLLDLAADLLRNRVAEWTVIERRLQEVSPLPSPATPSAARTVDVAFASETVVRCYPTPIALAYRRFLAAEAVHEKLHGMVAVVTVVLRYLCAIAAADLRTTAPEDLGRTLLRPSRSGPTLGTWHRILGELVAELESTETPFVAELPEVCRRSGWLMTEGLGQIVPERNRAFHPPGEVYLSAQDCRSVLRETRPVLEASLRELGFLQRYPLFFLEPGLGSSRSSASGEVTRYRLRLCRGSSISAPSVHTFSAPLPLSRALLARPDGREILQLEPFLTVATSHQTQSPTLLLVSHRRSGPSGPAVLESVATGEVVERTLAAPAEEEGRCEVPADAHLARRLTPPNGRLTGERLDGASVGPLELLEVLGRGGFGTIYLARRDDDGQLLAVKVLEEGADPRHLDRFTYESRTLRRLSGPGVIACLDAGIAHIGTGEYPWYAMEHAAHGDLGDRLRARRQALGADAVAWDQVDVREAIVAEIAAIADAVLHLHDSDHIHRDLKPGNVLVMDDGSLRLADFGLVRNLDPSDDTVRLTSEGAGAGGTRRYMAPEQLLGEDAGPEADLFSLAVLAAELLTGWPPPEPKGVRLEGPSPLADWDRLMKLPSPLRRLILRATDPDPARRARMTISGFVDELKRVAAEGLTR